MLQGEVEHFQQQQEQGQEFLGEDLSIYQVIFTRTLLECRFHRRGVFCFFSKVSTITFYFSFLSPSQYEYNMLCTSTVCTAKVKHNSIFAD